MLVQIQHRMHGTHKAIDGNPMAKHATHVEMTDEQKEAAGQRKSSNGNDVPSVSRHLNPNKNCFSPQTVRWSMVWRTLAVTMAPPSSVPIALQILEYVQKKFPPRDRSILKAAQIPPRSEMALSPRT